MKQSGVAILPVILLISGIVIELAIAGVVVAALLSNTVFSSRLSAEALAAARSGAHDAMLKIIRDKNFSYNNFPTIPYGYELLNIGDRASAEVIVCKDFETVTTPCDTSTSQGLDEITSIGTALTRKKKIQAVVGVDPDSGKINILSFEEVPL